MKVQRQSTRGSLGGACNENVTLRSLVQRLRRCANIMPERWNQLRRRCSRTLTARAFTCVTRAARETRMSIHNDTAIISTATLGNRAAISPRWSSGRLWLSAAKKRRLGKVCVKTFRSVRDSRSCFQTKQLTLRIAAPASFSEPNFAVSDTDAPVDRSQRNAVCRGKGPKSKAALAIIDAFLRSRRNQ